jgi:hypothetical protein
MLAHQAASPLAKRGEDCLPRHSKAKAGGEGLGNGAPVKTANPHPPLSQTHSFALTGAGASVSPKGREKGEANQSVQSK